MKTAFYVSRNEAADTWQLASRTGSPCMARGTLAAAMATAARLAAVKANRLEWPLPVFFSADDDTPGEWRGELNQAGEWTN